jgi:hypothetical protein
MLGCAFVIKFTSIFAFIFLRHPTSYDVIPGDGIKAPAGKNTV